MYPSMSKNLDDLATEVLDILDRWEDRLHDHHSQKREHPRYRLRHRMTVFIPGTETLAGDCAAASCIEVWSRNISQGGLGFLYPHPIRESRIIICLNPETAGTHWYHAEIVRSRQVHYDFWEFGARFLTRAEM